MALLHLLASAAPASGDVSTEIIIAALGAGGFGAIIAAVVSGVFSKKKLGAEATEIITKAAAGVVTNLEAENSRLVKKAEEIAQAAEAKMAEMATRHAQAMQDMRTEHAEEVNAYRRVLQLHVAWDTIAIAKMNEFGVVLPPAPPLLPPEQFPIDAG